MDSFRQRNLIHLRTLSSPLVLRSRCTLLSSHLIDIFISYGNRNRTCWEPVDTTISRSTFQTTSFVSNEVVIVTVSLAVLYFWLYAIPSSSLFFVNHFFAFLSALYYFIILFEWLLSSTLDELLSLFRKFYFKARTYSDYYLRLKAKDEFWCHCLRTVRRQLDIWKSGGNLFASLIYIESSWSLYVTCHVT